MSLSCQKVQVEVVCSSSLARGCRATMPSIAQTATSPNLTQRSWRMHNGLELHTGTGHRMSSVSAKAKRPFVSALNKTTPILGMRLVDATRCSTVGRFLVLVQESGIRRA
eukprot:COSAG02_NODE_1533_length_12076_cov_2.829173_6_plen_110_part_00